MEYIRKNKDVYDLHIIKTDRFKTITVKVYFRNEIEKEDITVRNLLVNFLMYATNTYPTKREMIFHGEDLYAAELYANGSRNGNMHVLQFGLSMLEEKYTEKGMLDKSVEFLADAIFHPNFNNEETFNAAYNFLYKQYEESIKNFKEHKTSYASSRMLEEMGKDEKYSYRGIGYLEDLKKINKEKLISFYNKIIDTSLIDIYVLGNVDDSIEEVIDKYFNFKPRKKLELNPFIISSDFNKEIKEIKEEDNNTQSKLVIGCKISELDKFERNYVSTIYNLILGGSSESKFFQIIREKNSLAYTITSNMIKLDNLMIIRGGISRDNYSKTMELVKKIMSDISLGEFIEEDIRIAKEHYISVLNETEDNPDGIIDTYCANQLLDLGDIETRKKEIQKVTKDEIIEFSKKVHIDTVFLLEGIGD